MISLVQPLVRANARPLVDPGASEVAGFDPLTISPSVWYDPSDLSSMKQTGTRAAPGAAAAVDSPVGLVLDKSGNNVDLTQATAGFRPTLRQSGSTYYLEFDGADDGLASATGLTWPASTDIFISLRNVTDTLFLTMWDTTNAGGEYFGVAQSANPGANRVGVGGTQYVNGTVLGTDTRGGLYDAIGTTDGAVTELQAIATFAFSGIGIGNYGGGFEFAGRIYGIIMTPALSADDRASVRTYLGAKAGVVL